MTKELSLSGDVFSIPMDDYIRQNRYDIIPDLPEKSQQETETSYLDAFASTKLPTRIGASAVILALFLSVASVCALPFLIILKLLG